MELIRESHEILRVQHVGSGNPAAVVRTHHTMYAHLELQGSTTVTASADLVLTVRLVTWDAREVIIDEDRTVSIHVEGTPATEVTTVAGEATVTLQFADPGSYLVEARHELATPAGLEVTVQ